MGDQSLTNFVATRCILARVFGTHERTTREHFASNRRHNSGALCLQQHFASNRSTSWCLSGSGVATKGRFLRPDSDAVVSPTSSIRSFLAEGSSSTDHPRLDLNLNSTRERSSSRDHPQPQLIRREIILNLNSTRERSSFITSTTSLHPCLTSTKTSSTTPSCQVTIHIHNTTTTTPTHSPTHPHTRPELPRREIILGHHPPPVLLSRGHYSSPSSFSSSWRTCTFTPSHTSLHPRRSFTSSAGTSWSLSGSGITTKDRFLRPDSDAVASPTSNARSNPAESSSSGIVRLSSHVHPRSISERSSVIQFPLLLRVTHEFRIHASRSRTTHGAPILITINHHLAPYGASHLSKHRITRRHHMEPSTTSQQASHGASRPVQFRESPRRIISFTLNLFHPPHSNRFLFPVISFARTTRVIDGARWVREFSLPFL
jgi:hypothetical protein